MIRCELCNSEDMVRANVEKKGVVIAICRECGSIYEVDNTFNPIFGHDPNDVSYFETLQNLFESWDEVTNVIPYNNE